MVLAKSVHAVIVESDGIQHSARGLNRTPGVIALAWLRRDGFGNDATQSSEIDKRFHLSRVTKRARCDRNRIGQL